MFSKAKKMIAAALVATTAFTFTAPPIAMAHVLSSAQEKNIGNEQVRQFKGKYRTYEDAALTHVQNRLIEFNSDKLWFYGSTGHKRGLERVLMADVNDLNAISYPGGQIFVFKPMVDFLASNTPGVYWNPKTASENNRQWRSSNIYQMSSLAALVGHEIGHWENEDMLRMYDKQFWTRVFGSLIPVGNVWALLGVAAGTNLINALNSRQMGFRTEQQADQKAMEYCEMVPEYSIGGEAIQEYRMLLYKTAHGIENKVNWLHPHSKTHKRLERALKYMEKSSRGFFKWKGLALTMNDIEWSGDRAGCIEHPNADSFERYLYMVGQIATSIKYDIARTRNLELHPESDVFTDGSKNNTSLFLRGHGTDGKEHLKLIDTYYGLSMKRAQEIVNMGYDRLQQELNAEHLRGEEKNLAVAWKFVDAYEYNLKKWGPRGTNASKYADDDFDSDDDYVSSDFN